MYSTVIYADVYPSDRASRPRWFLIPRSRQTCGWTAAIAAFLARAIEDYVWVKSNLIMLAENIMIVDERFFDRPNSVN
jgi:hypothetical protein